MNPSEIKPCDIDTRHYYTDSVFQHSETESVLRNIVLLQKETSPEKWIPFTWATYLERFKNEPYNPFKLPVKRHIDVLNALVNGGKPAPHTSAIITAGWLLFDGEHYTLSKKLIASLHESFGLNFEVTLFTIDEIHALAKIFSDVNQKLKAANDRNTFNFETHTRCITLTIRVCAGENGDGYLTRKLTVPNPKTQTVLVPILQKALDSNDIEKFIIHEFGLA